MSKKKAISGLATGAATGAAVGGAVGSIVPVIGTGIGGAVGAIGGGLIGLFAGANADDPEAQNFDDQAAEIERQKARAQKDAYQQFMLGEASRMGANPTLVARSQYENRLGDINDSAAHGLTQLQDQQQASQDEIDPRALVSLAQAGSAVGQGLYKQYANNVPTPVDIGASPEVNIAPDPENLAPLRRGTRMGFNGSTY